MFSINGSAVRAIKMPNDSILEFPGDQKQMQSGDNTAQSPAAAAAVNLAREEATKQAADPLVTRKRGRPPKDAGSGGGVNSNAAKNASKELHAQLDAVFAPEAWGALLAAPGDVAAGITGRGYWEITQEERKTLGLTGAAFARTMAITNPRSLAAMMVSASLLSVYLPRLIKEAAHMRATKKAEIKTEEKK